MSYILEMADRVARNHGLTLEELEKGELRPGQMCTLRKLFFRSYRGKVPKDWEAYLVKKAGFLLKNRRTRSSKAPTIG